jgi:hypothetical protein
MIRRLIQNVTNRWIISIRLPPTEVLVRCTVLYINANYLFINLVKHAVSSATDKKPNSTGGLWRGLTLLSIIVPRLLLDLTFMPDFILIGHYHFLLVLTHIYQIWLSCFTFLLGLWLLFVHLRNIVVRRHNILFLIVILCWTICKWCQLLLDSRKRTSFQKEGHGFHLWVLVRGRLRGRLWVEEDVLVTH